MTEKSGHSTAPNTTLTMIEKKYDMEIAEPFHAQVSGVIQSSSSSNDVKQTLITTFDDILQYDQLLVDAKKRNDDPDSNKTSNHSRTPNNQDKPFTTDDLNTILPFQSKELICSTLHFHDPACDAYFNEYSNLQEFGLLYSTTDNAQSIIHIKTSQMDLADTFIPKSNEFALRTVFDQVVAMTRAQNGIVHIKQHILKHHFGKIYKEYFLKHPLKSSALNLIGFEDENE